MWEHQASPPYLAPRDAPARQLPKTSSLSDSMKHGTLQSRRHASNSSNMQQHAVSYWLGAGVAGATGCTLQGVGAAGMHSHQAARCAGCTHHAAGPAGTELPALPAFMSSCRRCRLHTPSCLLPAFLSSCRRCRLHTLSCHQHCGHLRQAAGAAGCTLQAAGRAFYSLPCPTTHSQLVLW